jgi:hypothetical protein
MSKPRYGDGVFDVTPGTWGEGGVRLGQAGGEQDAAQLRIGAVQPSGQSETPGEDLGGVAGARFAPIRAGGHVPGLLDHA